MTPVYAMVVILLPSGETIQIWPEDDIAEHVEIGIQQEFTVWRRRLSELRRTNEKPNFERNG